MGCNSLCYVIEVVIKIAELLMPPLKQCIHIRVSEFLSLVVECAGGCQAPAFAVRCPQLHIKAALDDMNQAPAATLSVGAHAALLKCAGCKSGPYASPELWVPPDTTSAL